MTNSDENAAAFLKLVDIVAKLRDPVSGCPWDKEQTHESLRPYIIEESYEVIEAIDSNLPELAKELGDVLLQVLLHSQISKDSGGFTIKDVIEHLSTKLVSRHPHVFGDVSAKTSKEVLQNWEQIKQKELKSDQSILDGVPRGMPALLRAQRVGEKAARVGFEWRSVEEVKAKVIEEINEFLEANGSSDAMEDEFGDILFALTQLARRIAIDSENALHRSVSKFTNRFKQMEIKAGRPLTEFSLEELDGIWEEIKKIEKSQQNKGNT